MIFRMKSPDILVLGDSIDRKWIHLVQGIRQQEPNFKILFYSQRTDQIAKIERRLFELPLALAIPFSAVDYVKTLYRVAAGETPNKDRRFGAA